MKSRSCSAVLLTELPRHEPAGTRGQTLAKRKKPGENDFDTSPAAINQWIADLPIINTGKTRELLGQALEEINTLDIKPTDRYAAVELLSVPVLCVSGALKNEILGKHVPLLEKDLAKARHCLELYSQMATAYGIMAADLGRRSGKKQQLATAIHRALRYSSESLLTNYQIYLQYPAGLWKSIHTLYTAAEKEGLAKTVVNDTTLPSPASSTIETVYKQILLLSLANPYRLRQKEIQHVYSALLDWATETRLKSVNDKQDNGLFASNLLSDDPPSYRLLNSSSQPNEYQRILDTSSMASMLGAAVAENDTDAGRAAIGISDKDTLRRLMLAWGVMPKRRFSRHQAATPVKLIIGLDSIHRLAEESTLETILQPPVTAGEVAEGEALQDPTFENVTSIRTLPLNGIGKDGPLHNNAAPGTAAPAQIEAWKVADMSAGGYCLLCDSADPTSARVGELVAVRFPGDNGTQDWHLGVIRRIKFTRERGLELGLQMLSPGARPVWTRICRDDISSTNRMKGILLPEMKSLKQAASLVLPALPFRVGCTSTLEYKGEKETIVLTQQLENTGIFGQYHFTRAKTP